MFTTLIASTALLASSALAQSVGSAVVVNACDYPVFLNNVPASGGGFSEVAQTLEPNDKYEQQWTQLTNGAGWSMKLAQVDGSNNIMQYEYTFQNEGTIWYDLSDVNGNPWNGNWEIDATNAANDCFPKHHAYRNSTDDAYGEQSCTQDSTITVTLCSEQSPDDGTGASPSSAASVAATTSSASAFALPTLALPSLALPTATAVNLAAETTSSSVAVAPSPTTLATVPTPATSIHYAATVTEYETAIVTDIVTFYQHGPRNEAAKRHEHHRHHAHGHA